MEERGPSRAAITTATMRAAHYLLDAEPRILDDRFARAFAGFPSDEELSKALNALSYPDIPRMRTLFALRNRYAEDELVGAMERGISQYIILRAGLDSFAYRRRTAHCLTRKTKQLALLVAPRPMEAQRDV